MNRPYRLTPLAESDLTAIIDYSLIHFGINQTLKLKDAIDHALIDLSEQAGIGHARSDLVPEETEETKLRFYTVKRTYCIVYRPDTAPIEIVRLLYGAQDVPSKL